MKLGETLVLLGIFVVLPTIIVWLVSRYKKHETDKRAEGLWPGLGSILQEDEPAKPNH